MSDPLIAIIGRLSPDSHDIEAVRQLETLRGALFEIGRQLAIAGFRIMVYTAEPELEYAAVYVVEGYRKSGKAKRQSVIVRRPQVQPGDRFPEEETDPCYELDVRPSDSWEVAFYLSLFGVDGVLAVGNGSFTYLGGLHAIGARKPLVALGGFGGVASKILDLLGRRIPDSEYQPMAQVKKDAAWARSCVESLLRQWREADESAEMTRAKRGLRRSLLAGILSGALVLGLLIFVAITLHADTGSWLRGCVVALFPAIAGLVGGVQRVVLSQFRGEELPLYRQSFLLSGVLGFSAGGFAGAFYSLSQAISVPTNAPYTPTSLGVLALWAGTFGFVAGLSSEKVFTKLMGMDISLPQQGLSLKSTLDKQSTTKVRGSKS